MVCKIDSAVIQGMDAFVVTVETDVSDGLPAFDMVGLLSSEVKEARERVRTALRNSGFIIPAKRITINLAPADIRKAGTYFDIPLAVSILMSLSFIRQECAKGSLFAGELSLDGQAVRVNGILAIVLQAVEKGYERCFVPMDNVSECMLVNEIEVIGIKDIKSLVYMLSTGDYTKCEIDERQSGCIAYNFDFKDVKGQFSARRAAEITAAGMHNMMMIGSPGAGKSMIAKCMPSILPTMNLTERMEVLKVRSVAGLPYDGESIQRPFRNPHHTSTVSSLAGGGLNPKPGEITLAHRGVLFLDELPEFSRQAVEVLRQPLEDGKIVISRAGGKYCFPADFIFLTAMNPCKCGYYPDRSRCRCTEYDVKKYMNKISGPILDRIDICVDIYPVTYDAINSSEESENSEKIRERVEVARIIQQERFKSDEIHYNSQIDGRAMNEYCRLGKKEKVLMEQMFKKFKLSVRSYQKIIKVARTISDLEQKKEITVSHLSEAASYRMVNYNI